MKIGIGYDIHKLVAGRPLVLGGVKIPFDKGLLGHSDGDALLHAIADAMLGALSLGDIGHHFPDTDPKYKDADSAKLLAHVVKLVLDLGWKVSNIDSNIIIEKPRMKSHISKMIEKIAKILTIEPDCVSVKARSNEGVGAVGRGDAIVCDAVVLLEKV